MSPAVSSLSRSSADTFKLGYRFAELLEPGAGVALIGDLGAGKTVFVKGVCASLGISENITSPTFTLMREYPAELPVLHFDLFRLHSPQELAAIGFDEYLLQRGIVLVEWADRIMQYCDILPWWIQFEFSSLSEDYRQITISLHNRTSPAQVKAFLAFTTQLQMENG
ncbi:MAG: tRNA (adenosine(37)-N6)-threonylcarbamoyltransferase complex ATPase subunit type 1 TsaE [bacterium]